MSPLGWIGLALLLPAAGWLFAWLLWAARLAWARRRGADAHAAVLRRHLAFARGRGIEVVCVHTELVDLPADAVRAVAGECGYRLAGFEDARGPLRRRMGVFVRTGGALQQVLSGAGHAAGADAHADPGRQSPASTVERAQR